MACNLPDLQMAPQLSTGSIQKIYDTGDTTDKPTLQVWDVKRIGNPSAANGSERYRYAALAWHTHAPRVTAKNGVPLGRIVISDGAHYQQAMLATQQNSKVQDGTLVQNCCVALKSYICNVVQGKK